MIHGDDADFLVAVEVQGHVFHAQANSLLDALLNQSHTYAQSPQTQAEFIHVDSAGGMLSKWCECSFM